MRITRGLLPLLVTLPVASAVGGCGDSPPTVGRNDAPATTAPSGEPAPGVLVVRIEVNGGFVPPSFDFASLPAVSIYRDGTVITTGPTTMEYPGRALPNVLHGRITTAELDELVAAAPAAGVTSPPPAFGQPPIADAPFTRVFVRFGARAESVSVNALAEGSIGPGLTREQAANRQRLADYRDRVLKTTARATERYVPTALAVLVAPYPSEASAEVTPADVDWPGLGLATRPAVERAGGKCVAVTGPEFAEVYAAAGRARANARWHSEGKAFALTFRPQLPDEVPCAPPPTGD